MQEKGRKEDNQGGNSRLLTEILDSISDDIFALDREWKFIYLNQHAAANTGLKPQDLIGQNLWEKIPQISGTDHELFYRKAMVERKTQHFEFRGVITDRWYAITVYPSSEGIVVFWQEIAGRKQVVDTLRLSEQTLRLLWETMAPGVFYQDTTGKIISVNPAADRILGKSPDHFLGKTSMDLEHDTIREDGSLFPGMEHPSMIALETGQEIRNVVMGVP